MYCIVFILKVWVGGVGEVYVIILGVIRDFVVFFDFWSFLVLLLWNGLRNDKS